MKSPDKAYRRSERKMRKLKALLVVNHFLNTAKFSESYDFISEAAAKSGIALRVMTNMEVLKALGFSAEEGRAFVEKSKFDFVLFWDKDIRLALMLEELGLRLFNPSSAIEACDDKSLTYVRLLTSGIVMPKSMFAPKAFEAGADKSLLFDEIEAKLSYPLILKECYGSFGREVYLINNRRELEEKDAEIGIKPTLYQEFIASSYGRDVRINVVGDRVIAAMYREAKNGDFRANLTLGGSMRKYECSDEEERIAVKACKILGLDFAGVDLLFGEGGMPLLAEVNSNSQFINLYNATGVNMPLCLFEYIKSILKGE